MRADHFLNPQTYSKDFVINKLVFDRKLTFFDHVSQFFTGVRMIMRTQAGIHIQRGGVTDCIVTDKCSFYEMNDIIYTTDLRYILCLQ